MESALRRIWALRRQRCRRPRSALGPSCRGWRSRCARRLAAYFWASLRTSCILLLEKQNALSAMSHMTSLALPRQRISARAVASHLWRTPRGGLHGIVRFFGAHQYICQIGPPRNPHPPDALLAVLDPVQGAESFRVLPLLNLNQTPTEVSESVTAAATEAWVHRCAKPHPTRRNRFLRSDASCPRRQ